MLLPKRGTFFRVALVLLAVVLILGFCYAIDYSQYTPSTIDWEFRQLETDHLDSPTDATGKTAEILIHPMISFAIQAEYLGAERELSDTHRRCLEVVQQTFFPDDSKLFEVYQYEILIRDSDGKEYWLPIQESFRLPFAQEYYEGCQLTLFLIMALDYDHEPFALINEFNVETGAETIITTNV